MRVGRLLALGRRPHGSPALARDSRFRGNIVRTSQSTHLLEDGYDIRTIQELLGHRSVATTMIHTQVLNRGGHGIRSPLDERPWHLSTLDIY